MSPWDLFVDVHLLTLQGSRDSPKNIIFADAEWEMDVQNTLRTVYVGQRQGGCRRSTAPLVPHLRPCAKERCRSSFAGSHPVRWDFSLSFRLMQLAIALHWLAAFADAGAEFHLALTLLPGTLSVSSSQPAYSTGLLPSAESGLTKWTPLLSACQLLTAGSRCFLMPAFGWHSWWYVFMAQAAAAAKYHVFCQGLFLILYQRFS